MIYVGSERYNRTSGAYSDEKPFGVFADIENAQKKIHDRHSDIRGDYQPAGISDYTYYSYEIKTNGRINNINNRVIAEADHKGLIFND